MPFRTHIFIPISVKMQACTWCFPRSVPMPTVSLFSSSILTVPRGVTNSSAFHMRKPWPREFSDLPKTSQQRSAGTGIWTQSPQAAECLFITTLLYSNHRKKMYTKIVLTHYVWCFLIFAILFHFMQKCYWKPTVLISWPSLSSVKLIFEKYCQVSLPK